MSDKDINMNDVTHEDLRQIHERTNRADSRLSGLEATVSSMVDSLARIEKNQINSRPKPTWTMATVLTAVGMVGFSLYVVLTIIIGTQKDTKEYVDLRLSSLAEAGQKFESRYLADQISLREWMANKDAFQRETHYTYGVQRTEILHLEQWRDKGGSK